MVGMKLTTGKFLSIMGGCEVSSFVNKQLISLFKAR